MKPLFSILLGITCLPIFSQDIELFGGLNRNIFHDYQSDEGYFNSTYTAGSGYSFGLAIDSVKIDWITFRFTLKLANYSGSFNATGGGLGGGFTTEAQIDKSLISIGIFPINFQVANKIDLNIGLEISKLLVESYVGTRKGWLLGQPSYNEDLEERYSKFNSSINFGLSGRIAYKLVLNESIAITPQYLLYFGLSNEFIEFPREVKSIRHFFGIGVQKRLDNIFN